MSPVAIARFWRKPVYVTQERFVFIGRCTRPDVVAVLYPDGICHVLGDVELMILKDGTIYPTVNLPDEAWALFLSQRLEGGYLMADFLLHLTAKVSPTAVVNELPGQMGRV